jgi:hypothetical protein
MRYADVRERRQIMLYESHIAPLTAYADRLRACGGAMEVPYFDPLDGGIDARILFFLCEKPGPMTGQGAGSGFISRNNDDPSAEATFEFMRQAGIPRKLTVTWNVVPWWNGTRKVTGPELREGIGCVRELISLLPELRAVVLVGAKAGRAEGQLRGSDLAVFASAHPSPLVRASHFERWKAIPTEWVKALHALQCSQ